MKINAIHLIQLRNEEHYQYMTDFSDLVKANGADALGIKKLYASFTSLYKCESEALNQVQKSALTEEIAQADDKRDDTYRGLAYMVKSALNHFDSNVQAAAQRLQVVLDSYGNLAVKGYNEETAGIGKLVGELQTKYATDAASVSITDWAVQLNADNDAFVAKMNERYDENASQTQFKMKLVRNDIDEVYRQIIEMLNALILVTGIDAYLDFVNELNQRIEKYSVTIAQRQGRKSKSVAE